MKLTPAILKIAQYFRFSDVKTIKLIQIFKNCDKKFNSDFIKGGGAVVVGAMTLSIMTFSLTTLIITMICHYAQ